MASSRLSSSRPAKWDGRRHRRATPVDLLYVDTAHERADTIRELEAWRPVLRDGARVVLDDYTHPEFPGVR
ncbi:MAG: class I SAM-dependent methyltransferase [Solirubrobacterales bacterium]|nr:class I SAM-dependent methyltransferase [Solirubrobacterales bacterium]